MISSLGDGLNILISCDHIPGHSWMAYVCWYSISKNLPEAKVFVVSRRKNVTGNLFLWTKKVNIPFQMYNGEYSLSNLAGLTDRPMLIVPPESVAIRDFEEAKIDPSSINDVVLLNSPFVCDSKEDDACVFSSYFNGWGNFVLSEWIYNVNCPLTTSGSKRFLKNIMTINEIRIGQVWNASIPLFQGISAGKQ